MQTLCMGNMSIKTSQASYMYFCIGAIQIGSNLIKIVIQIFVWFIYHSSAHCLRPGFLTAHLKCIQFINKKETKVNIHPTLIYNELCQLTFTM